MNLRKIAAAALLLFMALSGSGCVTSIVESGLGSLKEGMRFSAPSAAWIVDTKSGGHELVLAMDDIATSAKWSVPLG